MTVPKLKTVSIVVAVVILGSEASRSAVCARPYIQDSITKISSTKSCHPSTSENFTVPNGQDFMPRRETGFRFFTRAELEREAQEAVARGADPDQVRNFLSDGQPPPDE